MAKRQPVDFNINAPGLQITNPEAADRASAGQPPVDPNYPAHLHKYAGPGNPHEYKVAHNPEERAALERQGYGTAQEADAAGRKAEAAAAAGSSSSSAPATRKPAAKKKAAKKPAAAGADKPKAKK